MTNKPLKLVKIEDRYGVVLNDIKCFSEYPTASWRKDITWAVWAKTPQEAKNQYFLALKNENLFPYSSGGEATYFQNSTSTLEVVEFINLQNVSQKSLWE